MEDNNLIKKINSLKKKNNAVILVHNYQRPEIYDVADFIGDSLDLSRKAAETKADIIVFCGVRFMAETAKILSPDKKVLLPADDAGCQMADMVSAKEVKEIKEKFPGIPVVCYVNTTAEVKSESDICCTSANAVDVLRSLPGKDVIFVPDKNLGSYVAKMTGKNVILSDGFCYVHDRITPEGIKDMRLLHPKAKVVAHPECRPEVLELSDTVQSTGGMIKYCKKDSSDEFIIATEEGMVNRLRKELPCREFYTAGGICFNMKKITLEKVLSSLDNEEYEIELDEELRKRAEKSLIRMLEI